MTIQMHAVDHGGFSLLGSFSECDLCGSVTSRPPDGPGETIVWGYLGGVPGVWRARGRSLTDDVYRRVEGGLELLADLRVAGSYQRELHTHAGPLMVSWVLLE